MPQPKALGATRAFSFVVESAAMGICCKLGLHAWTRAHADIGPGIFSGGPEIALGQQTCKRCGLFDVRITSVYPQSGVLCLTGCEIHSYRI